MSADSRRFSRETLCFLLVSAALAHAVYLYLSSEPLRLAEAEALSVEPQPPAAGSLVPPDVPVRPENELLRGKRRSPFEPVVPRVVVPPPRDPGEQTGGLVGGNGNGQGGGQGGGNTRGTTGTGAIQPPTRDISELRFTGIVHAAGRARALLLAREGAEQISVKPGDVLAGFGCTVTRIDKQAIHLTDARQRVIVLTDGR